MPCAYRCSHTLDRFEGSADIVIVTAIVIVSTIAIVIVIVIFCSHVFSAA